MTNNSPFHNPMAEQIWDMKYRLKKQDGTPIDDSVQDTWLRVANDLASVEDNWNYYGQEFYEVLENFSFIPAGRINAGAGSGRNVTLFNCLAPDTKIMTLEHGLVSIGRVANEIVHILDGNGEWTEAPIFNHGEQEVFSVTLKGGYNGRQTQTIKATAKHGWVLKDGRRPNTDELYSGDELKTVVRKNVPSTADYLSGVQHGIVYGDGSKDYGPKFRIQLCGGKGSLAHYFSGWKKTTPPCLNGDSIYFGTNGQDMKSLPSGMSVEYLTGFLRGWMATDGCVCKRDGKAILSCGYEESQWIAKYGAIAGMEVAYSTKLPSVTNYGQRNKEIYNNSFHRWTMIKADFLMAHHAENFKPDEMTWFVNSVSIEPELVDVLCPSVETTQSFQLAKGIHTSNCFVMGTIPDSLAGIFDMIKEAALTMQAGGGIGYDFSTIRPKGADVIGVAADASGPLSFMDVWNAMCKTIMSAGTRRGAMMATMRVDHPDIMDFIEVKRDPTRMRMFNLSVLVTDKFMRAVKEDADFDLVFGDKVYKTIKARSLWGKIAIATYEYAEPGVIFIDRINQMNNLNYIETIAASNPCGEQPLPPYGACLLGSINLAAHLNADYSLDYTKLAHTVKVSVRMLDNVVDVSKFPLPAQEKEAKDKRRIGLGTTGVADAMALGGIVYGTDEGAAWVDEVMKFIAVKAYLASIDLAKEKGSFPLLDVEKYLAGENMQGMPDEVRDGVREHGIRNALLTSIAPTGTISLYAGNVSSGIEPPFAFQYDRKVTQKDGSKVTETVRDYAVDKWKRDNPDAPLPASFVSAQTLSPLEHVKMQAAAQRWVDSSISKTINCPVDISFDDFKGVYMFAWDSGCKGCTTYRPNDITGSVLSVTEPDKPDEGGACELKYDPDTGQLIKTCE